MRRLFLLGCAAIAPAAFFACSVDTAAPAPGGDAGLDGPIGPLPDVLAPGADAASDAPSAIRTTLRFAHLSPDLGPIDACYRTSPGDWVGPVFASAADAGAPLDAAASDAGATGLAFANMSPYFTAPAAGTFDVALVAAGDRSCLRALAIGHVTIGAGKRSTIALLGLAHADGGPSALAITAFLDDPTPAPAAARVRFVHAALGDAKSPAAGTLAAALGAAPQATPIAAAIDPGDAARPSAQPPLVDALGYGSAAPLASPARLTLTPVDPDAGGAPVSTAAVDLGLDAGSVHSAFVLNDGFGWLAILWCDDLDPASACRVLSAK